MKILQVHNHYQQRGGEDAVLAAEHELLTSRGHRVVQYTVHNDAIARMSRLSVAAKTMWNNDTYRAVSEIVSRESPSVIHAHNTFPLISPSVYYAASKAHVPVVQTLHNFRLLCPAATLFRDGAICEDCLGSVPYHAVIHACYRNNRAASATVGSSITAHRVLGTWRNKIHTFVALSEFAKRKFIAGGLPAEKITVKPNFLARDPGIGEGRAGYALFAGRLSKEKGLGVLLSAWSMLSSKLPLKIAGEGDLRNWVEEKAAQSGKIEVLGLCERERVLQLLKDAAFLVVPSEWYEGLPMTIVEAFACGTPVITSRLESMDEFVTEGVTGSRFECGSPRDLARCIEVLVNSPELLAKMRVSARACYERLYGTERNYSLLMEIYAQAIGDTQVAKSTER